MAKGKPPIVEVEWLDARSVYEQIELGHVAEKCNLLPRWSVGYLVHKDRERIVIAGTFDPAEKKLDRDHTPDDDGGADFTIIPRGAWLKSLTVLVPEKEETNGDRATELSESVERGPSEREGAVPGGGAGSREGGRVAI